MPPLVGRREPHGWVLADLIVLKLDAGAPHRHVQLLPTALLPLLLEVDGEEMPPQVEVGANPQESFAQHDERCHVLDPIGIEMLQLNLIAVQQPSKEFVGGGCEPTLVEVGERHHIAVGWRWQILIVGQQPLLDRGPRVEKTTTDEALHALEGDVGTAPRIHWRWGRMDAGSTAVEIRRQET